MQRKGLPRAIAITAQLSLIALLLGGCLSQEEDDESGFTEGNPQPTNSAPRITGSPVTSIKMDAEYSFTPSASDPDGDTLTFDISSRPSWATFDSATGRLSGIPNLGDVGEHGTIVISVSDGELSDSLAEFSITVTMDNSAPTISGNPATEVSVGNQYSFTPNASDPDGDTLTFSISGKPGWADFNTSTGRLSGTPQDADVSTYNNISITVSDGTANTSLGPFSITVNAISLGSVTLNWTAPTENADGTTLTDLAGYRVYWGTTPGSYANSITIDNPGQTMVVIENLMAGTYEFVATSFDASGVESAYSNSATKIVQ